ncbi:MAG: helix-turn-helix transcriptional regulator [Lachnospiraceae bacterium]|nr:helix-turn-helix transcriptional regulator [Lachnospiraceae bacterium]
MSVIFENADSVVRYYASLLEKPMENYSGYMVTKALDDFSLQLVQYRMNSKLNQTELAKKLGISQSMVSQYEAGTNNITVKRMCEICESIGVRVQIGFEKANSTSGVEEGIFRFDKDNSCDVA